MDLSWLENEHSVEDFISVPDPKTISFLHDLPPGDIAILGVGGKIGPTLAKMLVRAIQLSKVPRKVYGVSRLGSKDMRDKLDAMGITTIPCDFAKMKDVEALPDAKYIIFLAGRKFGTVGSEPLTWVMNVAAPYNIITRYPDSQFVAFSTGCVYPLVSPQTGGCDETVPPDPVGEYANSCIGRERIFEYAAQKFGTKVLLYRLNYAIDVRYGVINDIAQNILKDVPIDLTVSHFNCIWQGEAINMAIRCLELADSPALPLNITGTEMQSVHETAERLGRLLDKKVAFKGTPGNKMYLAKAEKAARLLGQPQVTLGSMIEWTAAWLAKGGHSLDQPTHFTTTDGQFLDK